jgi:hypothetical protein
MLLKHVFALPKLRPRGFRSTISLAEVLAFSPKEPVDSRHSYPICIQGTPAVITVPPTKTRVVEKGEKSY